MGYRTNFKSTFPSHSNGKSWDFRFLKKVCGQDDKMQSSQRLDSCRSRLSFLILLTENRTKSKRWSSF